MARTETARSALTETEPDHQPDKDLDASVDAVIALCDGDTRAALCTLVVANDYLNAEVERLHALISKGYARGSIASNTRTG